MAVHHKVRVTALQVIYEDEMNPSRDIMVQEEMIRERLKGKQDLISVTHALILGVREHYDSLCSLVQSVAAHWALDRMAVTDRCIILLGAYELMYTDTPHAVIINDWVEVAKEYSSERSGSFVNGILDAVRLKK